MEKLKALVTADLVREDLEKEFGDRVAFTYDGYAVNHDVTPHAKLVEMIKDFDILICEFDTISQDVFDAAAKLKIIICCRGGVKTVIDLEAAKAKGVMVCNNAGRNATAVADMVMGYMLDMTRRITAASTAIHSGAYAGYKAKLPPEYKDALWGMDNDSPYIQYRGDSLNHMTLGIIGFGAIGRLIAKRAEVFGMKVVTYSVPALKPEETPDYVTPMSFDEVLKCADIVSVHVPLNPATRGMFGKAQFAAMKKGSYFVNAARGPIVVEADLIDALKSGHLAGAALDTLCTEPLPADSPLIGVKNLLITPHIAGAAYDVQACGTQLTAASLTAWLEGRQPAMRVA